MYPVGEFLRRRADFSPNLEALVSNETRITYREYNHRVNQVAHYLLSEGVEKGERIAVLCATDHPFCTLFYAIAKVGAILVPINYRLTSTEIDWMVESSKPRFLFYDEAFSNIVDSLSTDIEKKIKVSIDDELDPSFGQIFTFYPDTEPYIEIDMEETCVITFTSGTTGKPKGVCTTHANLYHATMASMLATQPAYGNRQLASAPLFHISGVCTISAAPLFASTLVFIPHIHPAYILDMVEKENINTLFAAPSLLHLMLPRLLKSGQDFPSLKEIYSGGSPVPASLIKQFDSLGYPLNVGYGATECTGGVTFWQSRDMDHIGSVGKLLVGEIKIIDPETNQELPPGQIGEIVVKGPFVFKGYWNDFEATRNVLKKGWFHTGDAGKIDEEGFLYIVDRYKDMIATSGEKVFPAEVEAVINQLDGVVEAAVIGVPDPVWSELARAYVVKAPESDLTETDVLEHCHSRLAKYKLTQVQFIDQLPKNGMGKVLKYVLRKQARQE